MQLRRALTRLSYASLAFFPLITGCGAEPTTSELLVGEPRHGEEDRTGEAADAIMGGYFDTDTTYSVAIARLGSQGEFGACSGTLISPNVVLTAQHCVAETSGNGFVQCGVTQFSPTYPPEQLYITTRVSLTNNINDYHRTREIRVVGGPGFCGNDVAVIILDDVVHPDEAQWVVPRIDTPLNPGEEYYAVGHGNTSDGPGGGGNPTRHRRDGLFTQCVASGCGLGTSIADTEWRGDQGVCQGDSGGGAYDLFNRVHGVASRGAQGCAMPVYGGVTAWADFLKEVTVYAAGLAAIDPPPWALGFPTDPAFDHPVGDACEGVDDCSSGACLDGYCTRPCNEAAYCPEGYQCGAEFWCEEIPEPEPEPDGNGQSDDLYVSNGGCQTAPHGGAGSLPWLALLAFAGVGATRRRRRS